MKKTRFTESQIVSILKKTDSGMKVEQLCRQYGMSSATYYNWKSKYGGMEASEVKRLKELEEENNRLKKCTLTSALTTTGTRECLAIEVDSSLPAARVIRVLERLKEERGLPKQLRMDNGPEFISALLVDWCEENGIEMAYIKPGKPQQNGFVERFNGSFRRAFLNVYLFETLSQVRDMAWLWMLDYNDERPHNSLGKLPPAVYRQQLENSSLELSH